MLMLHAGVGADAGMPADDHTHMHCAPCLPAGRIPDAWGVESVHRGRASPQGQLRNRCSFRSHRLLASLGRLSMMGQLQVVVLVGHSSIPDNHHDS